MVKPFLASGAVAGGAALPGVWGRIELWRVRGGSGPRQVLARMMLWRRMDLPPPFLLFVGLWLAFWLSWLAAAFWRGGVVARSAAWPLWRQRLLVVAGFVVLNHRASRFLHAPRLWHAGYAGADVLAVAMVPGFAFCWWARVHLGRLWSADIVRREGHVVVDTGPYRVVRHPIYTGILWAMLMTALAEATWVAFGGVLLTGFGFWLKARAEERFLTEELPDGAYAAYRARVPMLLPGL